MLFTIVAHYTRFILLYLLASSLKMNCYPINRNGKIDLNVGTVSFLRDSMELPFGVNREEANNIRGTLKKYEKQMTQLEGEAKYCKSNCFAIYNRLQVTS